jgi:signal peptidase
VKPPKKKGVLHFIGLGLSAGVFLLVVALAAVLIVIPKLSNATPLTVLTSSMEPGLPPGTLIYVLPVDPEDIKIGEVVTYQIHSGEPDVITHRVIGITPLADGSITFTFQGDNNGAPDEAQIIKAQIQGRLWYSVPYLGYVNNAVNGENRSWIIPVLAGGLIAYAAFMILSGVVSAIRGRGTKARRRGPAA